jgi:UDP-hydrolysing UDP-N-acetyl-D-glucosamine 2-epimerase
MKKVCIFTGNRAEYGLLYWLIRDLNASRQFELQLLVSGSHLSPEFGNTASFIDMNDITAVEHVEMLVSSNSSVGTAKSVGLGIVGYADALRRLAPDILVVLGDRFEALAVAQTALFLRVPVAHIHGGEVTEGAYDDQIRHAISKLSLLHFTSNEVHRKRVVQLGEDPTRVFNVGAIGLDHLERSSLMTVSEISSSLSFDFSIPYVLLTYHAATLSDEDPEKTLESIIFALKQYPEFRVVLTYPNADDGGTSIIDCIERHVEANPDRMISSPSLGHKRYLSVLKNARLVIGNSSSGIIEAPALGVATVNVGHRQRGRISANSVYNCDPDVGEIAIAIRRALDHDASQTINPYGQGGVSRKIMHHLREANLALGKKFYDLP